MALCSSINGLNKIIIKVIKIAKHANIVAQNFLNPPSLWYMFKTSLFIKVQNVSDPISFESNPWIELQSVDGENIFSSSSNLNDFKEFVYSVPETEKNGGVLTYTNSTGTYEGYRRFAIKIALLSENGFNVPRVSDYRGVALI